MLITVVDVVSTAVVLGVLTLTRTAPSPKERRHDHSDQAPGQQVPAGPVAGALLRTISAVPFADRPLRVLERHPGVHGTAAARRSSCAARSSSTTRSTPSRAFGHGRPAHGELTALIDRNRDRYADRLSGS